MPGISMDGAAPVDALAICLKVPVPGDDRPSGYLVGEAIGVVAYDATSGAWMPDQAAAAALPPIANRFWPSRVAAIDGLRRIILAPVMRDLLAIRVLSEVDSGASSHAFVRTRRRRILRVLAR